MVFIVFPGIFEHKWIHISIYMNSYDFISIMLVFFVRSRAPYGICRERNNIIIKKEIRRNAKEILVGYVRV